MTAVLGAAAERGRQAYDAWRESDDPLVDEGGIGRGFVIAPAPEWPDGWFTLQCPIDGSSWVGPEREPCSQCEQRIEDIQDEERRRELCRNRGGRDVA